MIINISELKYYSQLDEYLFFTGLNKIPGITVLDACSFEVDPHKMSKLDKHTFEGLLRRFGKKKYAQAIIDKLT